MTDITTTGRSVDPTGLIWQDAERGERMIGEIHRTRAGRFYVVIAGRRIAERIADWDEAERVALRYIPDADTAPIIDQILTGRWS